MESPSIFYVGKTLEKTAHCGKMALSCNLRRKTHVWKKKRWEKIKGLSPINRIIPHIMSARHDSQNLLNMNYNANL